jgi:hypothetical protein
MKQSIAIGTFIASIAAASTVSARSHRVNQIPHGDSYGCTSCHETPSGGGVFTGFGSDAMLFLEGDGHVSTHDLNWAPMATRDSDRDGFTNGEELGDPNGEWSIGDSDPRGRHYNPGDPNDHPIATCGDGRVTPPEECDGTNHADLSCIGLGLDDGVLTCRSDCTFDRSGCGGSPDMGSTTRADAGGMVPSGELEDDAACATVVDSPPGSVHWLLPFVFLGLIRLRRLR